MISELLVSFFKRSIKAVIAHGLLFGVVGNVVAQEVPVFVNQETGAQVDLIRPYWNANVDIANRRMQCDHFAFNEESAVYEQVARGGSLSGVWLSDGEFFHNPLSEGRGFATVDHAYLADFRLNYWNVVEGVYSGMAPLENRPFIEVVTFNAASGVAQNSDMENNAVRIWYEEQGKGDSYHVCYDLDGAPLVPTGSAETGNTDLLPEQNFTFQLTTSNTAVAEAPELVRIDTGEPVEFVRAEFDYNGDLKGKAMLCGQYVWSGQYYNRIPDSGNYYRFSYAYTGGGSVPVAIDGIDFSSRVVSLGVDDFFVLDSANYIELVDSGWNVWTSPYTGSFTGCEVREPFGPDGVPLEGFEPFTPNRILSGAQGSCDYSGADQYGGWGWNSVTLESCPPLEVITPINNCDYSNAEQFGGWGWDPVAQTSCAPNEIVAPVPVNNDAQCDYSNAHLYDGWGWNSILGESCPPQAVLPTTSSDNCVDDDNDGWGWNGTASCQATAAQCIDPDGDGWGWDGTSSCRVEEL